MARKTKKNAKAASSSTTAGAPTRHAPFAAAPPDPSPAKRKAKRKAAPSGERARAPKKSKKVPPQNGSAVRPINRELSWLAFDERVLAEARNRAHPLLERIKFLGISASNLEEFFMVRVAGLFRMAGAEKPATTWDGKRPEDLLGEIQARVQALEDEQNRLLQQELIPELAREGIEILSPDRLDSHQHAEAAERFEHVFLPVLTPMGVDPARPFPALRDQVLHLGIRLRKGEDLFSAFVPIPQALGRFVELAPRQGRRQVLPTEDLASMFLPQLFNGYDILGVWPFQILRDSDFDYEETEAEEEEDLLERVRREILHKHHARVIRLHYRSSMDSELLSILRSELELEPPHLYPSVSGRLWLSGFLQLSRISNPPPHLLDPAFPELPLPLSDRPGELFDRIAAHDILLHHPYDSFATVLRFLREAARDPQVLAIKQTLYRVSPDSAVVAALCQAAEAGKHVSVLVELKARFDERRNIEWAQRLEDAGVHVVHGLLGLKTHCKLLLVIRREESGIRRYLHLGTGNYNEHTSRIYTDFSLFTSDDDIVRDAGNLLNIITGFSDPPDWHALAVAPTGLRARLLQLIEREREHVLAGGRGLVLAKMNALVDPVLIESIHAAAVDGVEFRLLVRGICCLTPNTRKGAGSIQIRSIVDRFLEHSRLAIFHNDGRPEHFIGSADWMTRNFDRRIEVLCPVRDFACRQRLESIFKTYWRGGINVRHLQPDGSYQAPPPSSKKDGRPQVDLFAEARNNREHLEQLWHPEAHPSFPHTKG